MLPHWLKWASLVMIFGLGLSLVAGITQAIDPPQGKVLFYLNGHLYILDLGGPDLQQLPREFEVDFPKASWSPDGQEILFEDRYDGNSAIFLANVDDMEIKKLTPDSPGKSPLWSPNGEQILYLQSSAVDYSWRVFIMSRDGSNQSPIQGLLVSHYYISWSPDGQWLAISIDDKSGGTSQIYRLAIDTGELSQLTHLECSNYIPIWSPDGQYIAFSHNCPKDEDDAIYILSLADSDLVLLATLPETRLFGFRWSPDGRFVAYMGHNKDGNNSLFISRPDGSDLAQIGWDDRLNPIFVWDYTWSPTSDYIALSGSPGYLGCDIYVTDISCVSSATDCSDVVSTNVTEQFSIPGCPTYLEWAISTSSLSINISK